jgi:peptidyl-prolyl cis-trans isomerase D
MSIIQTIRDKYAKWAVIGIALAIIGFLLMDASVGRSRLLSGFGKGSVGSVNGKKISFDDFNKKVQNAELNVEQSSPGASSDTKRGQAVDAVWNQEVSKIILDNELSKLGIYVGENERADMIAGEHPSQVAQRYLGQQGQPYNGLQALQTINQIKRGNNAEQKAQVNELLNYMEQFRLEEKYNSIFTNSNNIPRWIIESEIADNSRIAKVSYVRVNYTDASLFGADSTIKVTDNEILAYVDKHKKQFKQNENRSISYVAFSAAPSNADSAAARDKVASLTTAFLNATDAKAFLDREGSEFPYNDAYVKASDMQQPNKDTLLKIPVGSTYGPYLDNTHYVTAKMIDSKMIPDSVTVRHILIQTAEYDQQNNQWKSIKDTAEGRRIMNDSVLAAINRGISFDSVCKKYSDDQGSKDSGGVYKNVKWGGMMSEFNDFIFTHPPAAKGVVYTNYGFHYIEVLKHFGAANTRIVKIAFLAKAIETSQETENDAASRANTFAGKARDLKAFDNIFEKELKAQGLNKGIIATIGPNSYDIGTIGQSRSLVKKIYDAKKGEVLQPEKVGNSYLVVAVTDIQKEGTKTAAEARGSVEAALRNKKKAEIIRKKIGTITTLEAAAATLNQKIETIDSVNVENGKALSQESKIIGACFNPANKGKVIPEVIEGSQGIYLVQVLSTGTAPVPNANVTENRKTQISARSSSNPLRALRESATIRDKRNEHY